MAKQDDIKPHTPDPAPGQPDDIVDEGKPLSTDLYKIESRKTPGERRDTILTIAIVSILVIVAVPIITSVFGFLANGKTDDVKEVLDKQIPPLTTILASIIAYYAGSKRKKD